VAGSAAAATHLAVLVGFTEQLGSEIGFCCATPVNYLLQHRYVFARRSRHIKAFAR
jgi:putative flippase GtrA